MFYSIFDRMLDDQMNLIEEAFGVNEISHRLSTTKYNVTYKDNVYTLKLNVPGYDKDDLTLSFVDQTLCLESNNKKINKKIFIPKTVDIESLKSTCEKGVLTITGSSKKEANKKLIPIL